MKDKVKKAIEQLERISNSLASIGETVDYTDMAIKALEQQSCEDCISREALRQKLQEHHNFFVNAYGSFKDMTFKEKARVDEIDNCIAMVINEPSVTPSYNSIKPELKPCEDCISRQAVKDMLTAEWTKYMPMELDMNLSFVLEKISELPSVTPQQTRWIPCSEKMPDINIHVLAQFVMGGMAECYYAHNWWHIVGGFRISGDEVIAWMPLPEPYSESEDKE